MSKSSRKKIIFLSLAILSIIGYGVLVFAAPPNGGYAPGSTLDPDCAPGDTDCVVAISAGGSIGIGTTVSNNPDLNGILYTDATNKVITDNLFVRDNTTKDTLIAKDVQGSYTQNIVTFTPIIISDTPTGTFQQGETVVGQTSGATAVLLDAYAVLNSPQWVLTLSSATGTFQQGETVVGQTSGAVTTIMLFSDGQFTNGMNFTVLDPNNNLNPVAVGTVTTVLGGGQYEYTLNSGSVLQGGIVLDNPNGPSVIGIVGSLSSNQISTTNQASFQLGTLLSGVLGPAQGVGNFYTSAAAGTIVGQWVGDDASGNINTFNNTAFDVVNTRGVFLSGTLGNPGSSPLFGLSVVDLPNNWSSSINIDQNTMEISHTNEIGLFANRIVVGASTSSPATYILPTGRGSAGQVLMDLNGDGNLSWQSVGGGGGSSPISVNGTTLYSSGLSGTGDTNGYNIFFGPYAGYGATNASNSNFFGTYAGQNATNASYSNFLGYYAGNGATNASSSNFFGTYAGNSATDASHSNFFGAYAGDGATGASNSNFFGTYAGQNATSASNSNFLGYYAGNGATSASFSNFLGYYAGNNATGASNSNFLGYYAGNGATNASSSNFLGSSAGNNATSAYNSNFFGQSAGNNATGASSSNFLGYYAGNGATNASSSNFLGYYAGNGATSAYNSNFFGQSAGDGATGASNSNFLGYYAGNGATSASSSNFLGSSAGNNATSAYNSNFLGSSAGNGATNASNSIFIGKSAGNNDLVNNTGSLDDFSILIGPNTSTGNNGSGVGYSNSIALGGYATNTASNQFMIGSTTRPINDIIANGTGSLFLPIGNDLQRTAYATDGAIRYNTDQACLEMYSSSAWACLGGGSSGPFSVVNGTSIFSTGLVNTGLSSNAVNSFFVGDNAGFGATGANNSNFFGQSAGQNATSAYNSNFLGLQAGQFANNAYNSNFFGAYAGNSATDASFSNFFGDNAGNNAISAYNSNFLGSSAGNNATNASYSNFFGAYAGDGATGASNSNFLGQNAGYNASNAYNSNFFGQSAGNNATSAYNSNFLGSSAGNNATNASYSNFLGQNAGYNASNAYNSNFFGQSAGNNATSAYNSNFLGYYAGNGATGASSSNFLGSSAGNNATNASNSIFIGKSAGNNDLVNNTGSLDDFSILIGPNTSTGNNGSGVGYSNSIALGGYATNTASNQFMIGSTTRPITQMFVQGSGNTCTLTTGTGWSCSSDERLKTNITDLTTDTLDKVLSLKTVNYNWIDGDNTTQQVGFLAQDLEQYFPQLVTTDPTGYKSVYYAQMTPILVEAIREMNLKITTINDMETPNTWRDALISWFESATNGIVDLFAKRIVTEQICLADSTGQTCYTRSQLNEALGNTGLQTTAPVVTTVPDLPTTTDNTDLNVSPENSTGAEQDTVATPDTTTQSPSAE